MTKLKKGLVAAAAVAVVGAAGLTATQAVSADTTDGASTKTSIVDKIATKFGLNKEDVQKVFDEDHATHDAERQAKQSERLQALVDKGVITADQKTKIETKLKELQATRESEKDSFKTLTKDERRAKMDANKAGLEKWATDNGIDLTKLEGLFMGGAGGRGHGPDNQ
jgi:hypothetical protein